MDTAAITSGPQVPQTATGIIFRTRPAGVLTERVRISGGGGGGRAREAGRGGGVFRVLAGSESPFTALELLEAGVCLHTPKGFKDGIATNGLIQIGYVV